MFIRAREPFHSNRSSYWFQVAERVDIVRKTRLGTTCPPIDFLQQSNLRSPQLTSATVLDPGGSSNKEIYALARYAVLKLPTLANLTLRSPAHFEHWQKLPGSWSWTLVATLPIQKVNHGLGIPCIRVHDMMRSVDVRWDAYTHGLRNLTWADGKYWQSIKRDSIGLVYSRFTGCKKVNLRTQHPPGSISFARQTFLSCPKQSCVCHNATPDLSTEGKPEFFVSIAELTPDGIAIAEAMMENGIRVG